MNLFLKISPFKLKKIIHSKISLFSFSIFIILIATSHKHALGSDERTALYNGLFLLKYKAWHDTVILPLYGIFLAMLYSIVHKPLLSGKIIYALFESLTLFPIYYLANQFFNKSIAYLSVLLIVFMPGFLILPLYSGTHPVFICLVYSSIAFLLAAIKSQKCSFICLSGFLCGLSYLTRMDGVIYALLICFGLFFTLVFDKDKPIQFYMLCSFAGCFFIPLIPWQIILYFESHALLSPVINKHFYPTVWYTITLFIHHKLSLSQTIIKFLTLLSLTGRVYSEALASARYIPIYIWLFVIVGLRQLNYRSAAWILGIPIIASLSYLFFHVLARYLTPMIPVICLLSAAGIEYAKKYVPKGKTILLFFIFIPLIISDILYLKFGHPTYSDHPQQTTTYYNQVLNPQYNKNKILYTNFMTDQDH